MVSLSNQARQARGGGKGGGGVDRRGKGEGKVGGGGWGEGGKAKWTDARLAYNHGN